MSRKRETETPDYAAMMRRMIAAHGRRVADADVEDLAELVALAAFLDDTIAGAVDAQRQRWGRSWTDIARAAGTTRQGAQQRWGRRAATAPAGPDYSTYAGRVAAAEAARRARAVAR